MFRPLLVRFVLSLAFLTIWGYGHAQEKLYFIEFADKRNSPYDVARPAAFLSQRAIERRVRQGIAVSVRDLPVNPAYAEALQQAGATVRYASRWMNGALVEADAEVLEQIRRLPFVRNGVSPTLLNVNARGGTGRSAENSLKSPQTSEIDYGNSLLQNTMLGVDRMHAAGFTGKGVHIAVLDGGFLSADQLTVFGEMFRNGRVLGTYDFVRQQTGVFDASRHGTQVLSALAGYRPGALVGPAFESSFWLFRTENERTEYRVEEVNWLVAAERADSAGADIIQSSLGYTTFDDPAMDYRPVDMNGRTAFITNAARMAAATGMLVVVSAGNEGNDPWRTLSAPADADSVLAVAAVDHFRLRADLSSAGFAKPNGRVKPDVAAQGVGVAVTSTQDNTTVNTGTSFSAPLVAGLAAGLWQAFPNLTNVQLIRYLQRSGHQAASPDTLLGYGIPDFDRAYRLIRQETDPDAPLGYFAPNPVSTDDATLYLKLTETRKPLRLQFYDLQGRLLHSQTIDQPESENRIPLPAAVFRPGLYVVRLSNQDSRETVKLVKQ